MFFEKNYFFFKLFSKKGRKYAPQYFPSKFPEKRAAISFLQPVFQKRRATLNFFQRKNKFRHDFSAKDRAKKKFGSEKKNLA
jgi:hypothetical protein